ncbi:hypothetical protein B0J14DRAFT_586303 [Halenospora varia]|nr:hypothetical protein B0J14DRAFT_586303 [Halenospora varia]
MVPGYPYDENRIDAQQQVLARLAPVSLDSTNPRCGGIGTQTWIPRDEGASAIEWFCDKYREGGTISGNPGEEWATKVQKSTMINIGIVFRESFSIPPSQCKALFYKVLDGCDGNEIDNPGNWKHGGSIVHPKGATLVFAPEKQPVPFCNDQGSPAGSAHWVDYGVGEKAVQSFCDRLFFPLRGSAGNRFQQTFGQGTSEQITLSMAFTEDFSLSMSDCVDGMRSPLLTCHRNDPLNNPDDNQYGGIFISDAGVIFRVTPDVTPPVYPRTPSRRTGPGSAGFEESINAFCVEGNPFSTRQTTYTFQLTDAETMKVNLFLTAKDVDVPRTYKQGPTVCRAHGPWKGKIIEQECKFAFHAMRDKCIANFEDADKFHPTTFVHNCVDYSFRTDLGQNSQAKVVAGAAIESGSSLGSPTTSINATGVFWSGATTGTAGPRPFLRRNAHKNNTGNLSYRYT